MPARIHPKIKKRCELCGKFFDRPLRTQKGKFKISWFNYSKRKFCSLICKNKWQSLILRGKDNPNWKGGTFCQDCGKRLSSGYAKNRKPKRCHSCYLKFIRKNPQYHPNWKGGKPICKICGRRTGDYYSKLCQKCRRGENHHCWKGGISKLSQRIKSTPQYRQWRKSIFQRDNYTCQKCGITGFQKGNNLCPHHIKPFALVLKENNIQSLQDALNCKELWDLNNGITLCRKCHQLTNSFAKKLSH